MKNQTLKNVIIIIVIISSFFLGRESKPIQSVDKIQPLYFTDSFQVDNDQLDGFYNRLSIEGGSDIVYRCGQSKIYHPSKTHASFKRCKSKVYELTVERAKKIGMRHCKCRY